MTKKTLALAIGAVLAAAILVPFESEAAQPGVMICRTNVNGVWQGTSCTVVTPSAPCGQIDVCSGCGCWDVNAKIDPNSTPPTVVGKKKTAEKDEKKKL